MGSHLGRVSHLRWFMTAGNNEPASTPATSGGITQAINTELIRKYLTSYANVSVTSQGHGLCVCVWTLLSESGMD